MSQWECDTWKKWILYNNLWWLAQWLDREEAPKHFPKAKLPPKNGHGYCLVVCCPYDTPQLSNPSKTITSEKHAQQISEMHWKHICSRAYCDKNQNCAWDSKFWVFRNNLPLLSLTVWITVNCGKFWKRWEYQTTWSASWEICMQVRKQQLELDMGQQTGSK